MCDVCGCSGEEAGLITHLKTGEHVHLTAAGEIRHSHAEHLLAPHGHGTPSPPGGVVKKVERDLLARNREIATRTRKELLAQGILMLNFMSSPGAGKTTLLEKTLSALGEKLNIFVLEGDQATTLDGDRLSRLGRPVAQINTGMTCHLDAAMIKSGVDLLKPPPHSTLFVENVGNLVCPSFFDLGENFRIVVASLPEGEDKPVKYPQMFQCADLVILNKMDLAPHLSFSTALFERNLRRVNSRAKLFFLSCTSGTGMPEWFEWLEAVRADRQPLLAASTRS